jgi:hypothetical protein
LAAADTGARSSRRQLPITRSAHKAAVIGDPPVAAVLACFDMTAEGRGAAMLDRRHDFELMKAQVSGMGGPISGAGGAEDIGDLERGAHRLSRRVRSLRPGTCRACRAGSSRCVSFGSQPWCRRRCSPAWRGQAVVIHNAHPAISLKLKDLLRRIWCYRTC